MRPTKLFIIFCLLFVVSGGMVLAETAVPTAVITVNSEGDAGYLPGVSCVGANECTLRQAISLANGSVVKDTIRFDTSAFPDGMVITPQTALPDITKSLDIDGVGGNPGACPTDLLPATLTVTIDGSDVEPFTQALATYGFLVKAQDSTVKGLSIVNFPGTAVILEGANTAVTCNHLGLTPDGEAAGNFYGVQMQDGANQVVGGDLASDRNVISDNISGVHVSETNFVGRLIVGNYIGLDAHGISAIGNFNHGIYHEHDNVIIRNNVISANGDDGIFSKFGDTTDVTIEDNVIGLSAIGNIKLGNEGDGIEVRADNTVIADNVVADNGGNGIHAINGAEISGNYVGTLRDGATAAGNAEIGIYATGTATVDDNVVADNGRGLLLIGDNITVTNNRIGTSADGNSPLGNWGAGIELFDSDGSQIGGVPSERNIIGDNITGIVLASVSNSRIESNYIGVGADGVTEIGNTAEGIILRDDSNNNQIGTPAYKNIIANNSTRGLELDEGIDNNWRSNVFYGNGGLGINLRPSLEEYGSVTPNDAGDVDSGPNNLQNFMELSAAEATGRLVGTLEGSSNPYTIDIYQVDSCDGSGFGEGGSNLIKTYTRSTSGGVLNFDELISPAPPLGSYLLTLVTDADGNTSEFGNCVQVVEASFVIDSTADFGDNNAGDGVCESAVTGVCTLRAVIEEINALGGGPYDISFNLPGVGSLPYTIEPGSPLPAITTPIILDASTLTNASCPSGSSAANHRLILDGTNATGDGLTLAASASGSTIRGLLIRNFPGDGIQVDGDDNVIACNTFSSNGVNGINVNGNDNRIGGTARSERNVSITNDKWGVRLGNSATRNKVQGNYIGVAGDGTTAAGNGDSGVFLSGGGTNRIGGSVGFAANVIADNGAYGIEIDAGAGSNQIWGNIIGLDAAGSVAMGNTNSGIYVNSANANEIGGDSDSKRNVIAANGGNGIYVNSSSNVIQRNFIGTDASGLVDLGNSNMGIRVIDGDSNVIGGDNAADGNLIAGNNDSGIYVAGSAVATTIRYNEIGVNAGGNPLGNTLNGVHLAGQVSQAEVRNNTIAHNGLDGIAVFETVILSNFSANEIYDNGQLGIDLNNDGVVNANDANDGDNGGNGLMNYPIILGADAGSNTVTIYLNSLGGRDYRIHVYRNRSCDSSGHGEGERYLGSFDVQGVVGNPYMQETGILANNFNIGDQITATATPLTSPITDGTSEFSSCFTATGISTPTQTWGDQQVGFVMNTTSGMQPALDTIHGAWMQSIWADCPTCTEPTMHLVPFKDTAVYLGSTEDTAQFGDWLGDLEAAGGGACPDDIFAGLREFGLNLADDGAPVSDAIVFSDSAPAGNRRAFGFVLDKMIARGIRVHNVGPTLCNGGSLPDTAMNYLALLSGGTFHNPASVGEYGTDVQMAINLAMSQDLLGTYVGTLNNSTATFPFEVDSEMTTLGVDSSVVCPTCVAETAVSLSETITALGGVTVELIDPDGNVIDAATPGYQQWQTSTREMQMLFETVDSSDAGTWQLRVSGNGQYAVNLFGSSALHMTSVGQHTARVNNAIQVGALITAEEGASCSGCTPSSVTLTLVGLDNTETIPVTISGNTPPAVYGGSVTVSTPGLYRLMAEGVLENGSQFVRVDPTPIRVRAHGVSGSGDDSAVPGSTRSLSFELSNDGAAATFDLELFSEMGWTATDSIPDSVTLAAGESVVYTVNAVIPADAQIGSAEESVFVAVPQDDLSAVVSVSAKTAVVDYQRIFLPMVIR